MNLESKMRISYRQRIIAFVLLLIIINSLALTITMVDKGSYKNSLYYQFTRQRFAWTVNDPVPKYAIKAGWAKVNSTPSSKTPMANGQAGESWTSVQDSIYTRAVVLDNGTTLAAIVTIDLLVMPPTVAQELKKRLPKIGMDWKNVYLGATNSHHSLGGWATDYISKRTVGEYDEKLVSQLTDVIVKAITLAKNNRATAQIGYAHLDLMAQQSGSSQEKAEVGKQIYFLKLRKLTGESALICSTNDNQFLTSTQISSALSRDKAGELTDKLEKRTRSFTLFMAGPVELIKATQTEKGRSPAIQVDSLLARISPVLMTMPVQTDSTLIAQTTPLILSDPHVRFSKNWRLKPWLVRALYGDYPAELKAIRIGKTVFLGMPGAVSEHVLPALFATPAAKRTNLIVTSYNGGTIGQLLPDTYYYADQSPYNLQEINRFGPHTEAFFVDMTQSLVNSLK